MNKNNTKLLECLPSELQTLAIEPRHKILLKSMRLGNVMWTVFLTDKPGQTPCAWRMNFFDFLKIEPKHGSRTAWIRKNLKPWLLGQKNKEYVQLSLTFA